METIFYEIVFGYTATNSQFSSEIFDRFLRLQTLTSGNTYGGKLKNIRSKQVFGCLMTIESSYMEKEILLLSLI